MKSRQKLSANWLCLIASSFENQRNVGVKLIDVILVAKSLKKVMKHKVITLKDNSTWTHSGVRERTIVSVWMKATTSTWIFGALVSLFKFFFCYIQCLCPFWNNPKNMQSPYSDPKVWLVLILVIEMTSVDYYLNVMSDVILGDQTYTSEMRTLRFQNWSRRTNQFKECTDQTKYRTLIERNSTDASFFSIFTQLHRATRAYCSHNWQQLLKFWNSLDPQECYQVNLSLAFDTVSIFKKRSLHQCYFIEVVYCVWGYVSVRKISFRPDA